MGECLLRPWSGAKHLSTSKMLLCIFAYAHSIIKYVHTFYKWGIDFIYCKYSTHSLLAQHLCLTWTFPSLHYKQQCILNHNNTYIQIHNMVGLSVWIVDPLVPPPVKIILESPMLVCNLLRCTPTSYGQQNTFKLEILPTVVQMCAPL